MSNRDKHPTKQLLMGQIDPNYGAVCIALEKLRPEKGVHNLKVGFAVEGQDVLERMKAPDAHPGLVDELQEIVDALRRMPWEGANDGDD